MPIEIAIIVSSYQRPRHLQRCLLSIAAQKAPAGTIEVIVTDDGSTDETEELVARFARQHEASFTVRFTTHAHDGFQLARCRNDGIRASTAPYLIFTDGDCLLPVEYLREHLAARRPGRAVTTNCYRLPRETSETIDLESVTTGAFQGLVSADERRRLRNIAWKNLFYQTIRSANRPKLLGGCCAIWRSDLEAINGYDENFRAWGCEDDDIARRLRAHGVRIRSLVHRTRLYHLWHEPSATVPKRWREGANVSYLNQSDKPIRCVNGLHKTSPAAPPITAVAAASSPVDRARTDDALRV